MGSGALKKEMGTFENNPELTKAIQNEYERLYQEGWLDSHIEEQLKERFQTTVEQWKRKHLVDKLLAQHSFASTDPIISASKISQKNQPCSSSGQSDTHSQRSSVVIERKKTSVMALNQAVAGKGHNRTYIQNVDGKSSRKMRSMRQSISTETMLLKPTKALEECAELKMEYEMKPMTLQQGGVHYKLLYEGPKLFWRNHLTVDISIYQHIGQDCIEVIGFEVDKFREINRTYLKYSALLDIIADDVTKRVEERKMERSYRMSSSTVALPSEEVMQAEAKTTAVIAHILDRSYTTIQQITYNFKYELLCIRLFFLSECMW